MSIFILIVEKHSDSCLFEVRFLIKFDLPTSPAFETSSMIFPLLPGFGVCGDYFNVGNRYIFQTRSESSNQIHSAMFYWERERYFDLIFRPFLMGSYLVEEGLNGEI